MKTKTEIFELMIIELTEHKYDGLCTTLSKLSEKGFISQEEYNKMFIFIREIKPKTDRVKNDMAWWWEPCIISVRIKWMKRQIEKIKNGKISNKLK